MASATERLCTEIRACSVCAPHLPHGTRPVVQLAADARLVIIGQAPGARVHASGIPWDDDSGARLRQWTGLDSETFYDARRVALMPMGFCYPGTEKGADLPPRPECAPLWHDRILETLPAHKVTLLVGLYAHARYLGAQREKTLTDTVRNFRRYSPRFFPLPHPSWRSTGWMKRNPWFEAEVLAELRSAVAEAITPPPV